MWISETSIRIFFREHWNLQEGYSVISRWYILIVNLIIADNINVHISLLGRTIYPYSTTKEELDGKWIYNGVHFPLY